MLLLQINMNNLGQGAGTLSSAALLELFSGIDKSHLGLFLVNFSARSALISTSQSFVRSLICIGDVAPSTPTHFLPHTKKESKRLHSYITNLRVGLDERQPRPIFVCLSASVLRS
jgi:hypothetical protein